MNAMDPADESDSSSQPETLDEFRAKWQRELVTNQQQKQPNAGKQNANNNLSDEKKAEELFSEATELERKGKVFEAMRLYRRAVQLDPDIEFKAYEASKNALNNNLAALTIDDSTTTNASEREEPKEDLTGVDLVDRFRNSLANGNRRLIQRDNADKGVIVTGYHIGDLPMEIILIILRWVVSSHLDLRSLEQCAMTSKGFYLCARDVEIWKSACVKCWGRNILSEKSKYLSWRQMYIERPRVCFGGCYISKTSYIRYGERSFQDQYYRPVHLIEYYRYLRFFPDGSILMMTTSEEPAQIVQKLKKTRSEVLHGHFRFSNDLVVIMLKKNVDKLQQKRIRGLADFEEKSSFVIQFQISFTKKRREPQLLWKQYSIIQRQNKYEELSTDFELTTNKYPPLIFSRVKSYETTSDHPL